MRATRHDLLDEWARSTVADGVKRLSDIATRSVIDPAARRARRDYIQRPSRVCRKTYAQRSVGVRCKAPGAHAETEQMSTGRTRVRGVTKRKEARQGDASRPSRRVGRTQ